MNRPTIVLVAAGAVDTSLKEVYYMRNQVKGSKHINSINKYSHASSVFLYFINTLTTKEIKIKSSYLCKLTFNIKNTIFYSLLQSLAYS